MAAGPICNLPAACLRADDYVICVVCAVWDDGWTRVPGDGCESCDYAYGVSLVSMQAAVAAGLVTPVEGDDWSERSNAAWD